MIDIIISEKDKKKTTHAKLFSSYSKEKFHFIININFKNPNVYNKKL